MINKQRLNIAGEIADKVLKKIPAEGGKLLSFIGRISMHPLWGIPLLLIVLYGLYQFVGVLGAGTLVNFFEKIIFGKYLNPMAIKVVQTIAPEGFIQELLVGEYGLITVALTYAIAIILPITATFLLPLQSLRTAVICRGLQ